MLVVLGMLGCVPNNRPDWWKAAGNLQAHGAAQADGATGVVAWHVSARGEIVCPVLWSPKTFAKPDDARVIFVDALAGVHATSAILGFDTVSKPAGFSSVINTCPAAPIDDPFIYFVDASGIAHAVPGVGTNPAAGWTQSKLGLRDLASSVSVWYTFVYFTADTRLFALNRADGTLAWVYQLDGAVMFVSSPVVTSEADNAVIVATTTGSVYKVNAITGQPIASHKVPGVGFFRSWTIGSDFTVYLTGNDGRLYALDPVTLAPIWTFDTNTRAQPSGVALVYYRGEEFVYFTTNKDLYAIHAKGNAPGSKAWQVALPTVPISNPVVTPSEVVYLTVGFTVDAAAVIAVTQKGVQWSVPTHSAMRDLAVGVNGYVYATGGNGLFAIK